MPAAVVMVGVTGVTWLDEGREATAELWVPVPVPVSVAVALAVGVGVRQHHSAFWLWGTTLIQRRVRGDRYWDLTAASIRAGRCGRSLARGAGPVLFISAPGVPSVALGLHRPNLSQSPIEPGDLLALAEAIGSADDPQMHTLAAELRQQAESPFGHG